jgi:predicted RNA-binding protein YlxR (DUF448 family)/ribosomal protein L30E
MKAGQLYDTAPAIEAAPERTRMCVVSRALRPERDLVRFVVGPEGRPVPDLAAKLPGRGIWVTASRGDVDAAVRKQAFARSQKSFVRSAPALADDVERLLVRRCLNYLGLAARAGELVFGFDQTKAALTRRPVVALIEASDGAADGRDKLLRLAAHLDEPPVLVAAFTGGELGLALGRDYVVHAALEKSGLAAKFLAEIRRLSGFRRICPADWGVACDPRLVISPHSNG